MNRNLLSDILHSYDLRATDTRLQVLNVLINSKAALSHHEIAGALKQSLIDKVTIYRTLDAFEKKGLIHKVASKDRNWMYAIQLKKEEPVKVDRSHAHFICNQCGRIYCLPVTGFNPSPDEGKIKGFKIETRELRYHGLCPDCLSSRENKNKKGEKDNE